MRIVLAAAAALVTLAAGPVTAEEFPWCVELDMFTRNCAYANHDECMTVANNAIGPATGKARCIANPSYTPPAAQAKAKRPAPARPVTPAR